MTDLFPTITARDWRDSIKRSRAQRNEVAEQIKQHMSTNNDGWILMSERKPTEADLPVWIWRYDDSSTPVCFRNLAFIGHDIVTHWKPAAADIPAPPGEKTQAEKDEGALIAWMRTISQTPANWTVWHAALAYERAEVGKMLPQTRQVEGPLTAMETIEAIRARCGGAK